MRLAALLLPLQIATLDSRWNPGTSTLPFLPVCSTALCFVLANDQLMFSMAL